MSRSTSQIERELEETRAEIEGTVRALREKMTAGQLVDEVARQLGEGGGGELMRNLGRQVRDNPLPLAIVGAGLAWLMLGEGRPRQGAERPGSGEEYEPQAEYEPGYVDDRAGGVGAEVRRLDRAATGAGRTRRTLLDLIEEQPLVLGAIGVAVGAAIGASMPASEPEGRSHRPQRDPLHEEPRETVPGPLAGEAERGGEESRRGADGEAEARSLSPEGERTAAEGGEGAHRSDEGPEADEPAREAAEVERG